MALPITPPPEPRKRPAERPVRRVPQEQEPEFTFADDALADEIDRRQQGRRSPSRQSHSSDQSSPQRRRTPPPSPQEQRRFQPHTPESTAVDNAGSEYRAQRSNTRPREQAQDFTELLYVDEDGFATDPKTGVKYRPIGRTQFTDGGKSVSTVGYLMDDAIYDLDQAATGFLDHLRVPLSKAESAALRKEKAARARAQASAYEAEQAALANELDNELDDDGLEKTGKPIKKKRTRGAK